MTIEQIIPIIQRYYSYGNTTGGTLHIVLDDGNLEDGHIEFCLEEATRNNDTQAVFIARMLLNMSMTQRRKLYGKYAEYSAYSLSYA